MTQAAALRTAGAETERFGRGVCSRLTCNRSFYAKTRRPDGLCKPHGMQADIDGTVHRDRRENR